MARLDDKEAERYTRNTDVNMGANNNTDKDRNSNGMVTVKSRYIAL